MSDVNSFHKAIGSLQTIPVTTAAAVGITTVAGQLLATKARFTVIGDDIRYQYDGSDPTTAVGHYAGNYWTFELFGHTNLDQFRMIATTGSATVTVQIEAPE